MIFSKYQQIYCFSCIFIVINTKCEKNGVHFLAHPLLSVVYAVYLLSNLKLYNSAYVHCPVFAALPLPYIGLLYRPITITYFYLSYEPTILRMNTKSASVLNTYASAHCLRFKQQMAQLLQRDRATL